MSNCQQHRDNSFKATEREESLKKMKTLKNPMIVFKLVKKKLLSWLQSETRFVSDFAAFKKLSRVAGDVMRRRRHTRLSPPTSTSQQQPQARRRRRRLTSTQFLKKVLRSDKDEISFSFFSPINWKKRSKYAAGIFYCRTNSMNVKRRDKLSCSTRQTLTRMRFFYNK